MRDPDKPAKALLALMRLILATPSGAHSACSAPPKCEGRTLAYGAARHSRANLIAHIQLAFRWARAEARSTHAGSRPGIADVSQAWRIAVLGRMGGAWAPYAQGPSMRLASEFRLSAGAA